MLAQSSHMPLTKVSTNMNDKTEGLAHQWRIEACGKALSSKLELDVGLAARLLAIKTNCKLLRGY